MDLSYHDLSALLQVILIDIVLAGDNAIVVGMAASRVAPEMRVKVIFWGIAGAVILRIFFAAITAQLLSVVGLLLAGGILLLWVCWKMYREVQAMQAAQRDAASADDPSQVETYNMGFCSAIVQIIIADASMSLDNVLAVAGAAKGNLWVLVIGLVLSIILMAIAANMIARLLTRFPWIMWFGLLTILYVALHMVWRGSHEVACMWVSPAACESGVFGTFQALMG